MMRLDDREWKPISIASIFTFIRGRENNMAMLEDGNTPLISARNVNNGLKGFVNTPKKIVAGNCITLNNDGDGGAGLAYYQPADMALDTHVTALVPKSEMNMFVMLFISECLSKLHGFFGHGLSISNPRAEKIRIMLPVTDAGVPDYQFMENYMRELMDAKKKQYRGYIEKRLSELCAIPDDQKVDWKSMIASHDWKPFYVVSIFPENERGKRLKKADHVQGNVPYASSTGDNNGIDGFIEASEGTRVFNDCISLANSGSVGSAFYEPFEFVASDHVTHLKKDGMSKYQYLFLTCLLKQQSGNFNFNREINDARLKKMQIMLPVTDDGQPDYDFMEEFGKKMMSNKYNQYLAFLAMSDTIKV